MSLWNRSFIAIGNHSRRFASQAPVHGHLQNSLSPFTPKLKFFNSVSSDGSRIPTYRILDGVGIPLEGAELPKVLPLSFFPLPVLFLCSVRQIDEVLARKLHVTLVPLLGPD